MKGIGMKKKTRHLLMRGNTLSSWACLDDNGHYSRSSGKNLHGDVESKATIVDIQGHGFPSHVKNLRDNGGVRSIQQHL